MTATRRYQIECAGFTLLVLVGCVLLVGESVVHKVKGALL
jgi:hypothetical protein